MAWQRRKFLRNSAIAVTGTGILAGCSSGNGSSGGDSGGSGGDSGSSGGSGGDSGSSGGSGGGESVSVRIQAGAPGTSFYAISAPLGDILRKHTSDPKIEPTVSSSGGSVSNTRLLLKDQTEVATAVASVVHSAYNGNDPFDQANENVRCLMRGELFPQFFVVRADSDIDNMMDLDGRRVSAGPTGSGMNSTFDSLEEMFGFKADQKHLKHSEGGSALKDGDIDAWFIFLSSTVSNAFQTGDLRVVGFTQSQVEKIRSSQPWVGKGTLTPDRLGGMKQDSVSVIGGNSIWTAQKGMDDSVAYEMTRAALENPDQIIQNNVNSRNFSPEFAHFDFGVPYHEGAKKYYKEAGVL